MSFCVIIPARLKSTRLPGKVLLDIAGQPMVQHVYDIATKSGAKQVIIATDSTEVEQVAHQFGADVCMTSADHPSGTSRIAEVVQKRKLSSDTIIVGLQGDEPLMPPQLICQVAKNLQQFQDASMTTLCELIENPVDLNRTSIVKVIMDKNGYALYFSRSVIPFSAHTEKVEVPYYRHIGLYAYRAEFVARYVGLSASIYERAESLEQLRALWHGYKIHVEIAKQKSGIGVDTPEDIEKARQYFKIISSYSRA